MPISIRFLIFGQVPFDFRLKVRFKPPPPSTAAPQEAELQRTQVERPLSTRLPRHLVRDVLPD